MKNWMFVLFTFTAIIRSSEVKEVRLPHGYRVIRLCANFDILQDGKTIGSSFQCDEDWKGIEEGIRYQLEVKQKDINEVEREVNRVHHLHEIQNDEIGKVIKP